jgi:hypothetical protein
MYHWFFLLEITAVKIMNNLNACSAHSYLYPRSRFKLKSLLQKFATFEAKSLTGMVTSVPPYETFSFIKNNILHQSKNYKNHFENSNSEVCELQVTLVMRHSFINMLFISSLSWSHYFKSFTVATMTWLTVMEYLCLKWPRICSTVIKLSSISVATNQI